MSRLAGPIVVPCPSDAKFAQSGLEEAEVENFGQTVRTVPAAEGCAVVLIEHDVGFVMRHSDRVVALNLGQILADGTPEQVRNDPAVAEAYFGA